MSAVPTAVLAVLLRDRPRPAHERITRTATASRCAGGWSCVWDGPDGVSLGIQFVTDAEVEGA